MGFKLKMDAVSQEDLNKIREERPTGGYDGPIPPPGVYEVKIAKVWIGETNSGAHALKVSMVFDNEGENAIYNRASLINNYMIPTDASQRAFPIQVDQLDTFMNALSDGKADFRTFQKAFSEGKTDADPSKKDKIGIPVTQIGPVKITGTKKITVKTKIRDYNGKDYIDLHYILRDDEPKKSKSEDSFSDLDDAEDTSVNEDTSSSSDDSDDLEEWLDS